MTIGGVPVGIFTGDILLDEDEIAHIKGVSSRVHDYLLKRSSTPEMVGVVRYDYVPHIVDNHMTISGIYEANYNAPEDPGAMSNVIAAYGEELRCMNIAKEIAEKIKNQFGDQRILFIPGRGKLKDEWGKTFFDALSDAGLNIDWVLPQEFVELYEKGAYEEERPIVWRWGDMRREHHGKSDFDQNFVDLLFDLEKQGYCIINSLPGNIDISNKRLLLQSNDSFIENLVGKESRPLSPEFSLGLAKQRGQKNRFVLKPDGGSSGEGITFGRLVERKQWTSALDHALARSNVDDSYSLWQFKELPKVDIGGVEMAMDISPCFWSGPGGLEYLYTLMRVRPWDEYLKELVLNVSRGAGFMPAKN